MQTEAITSHAAFTGSPRCSATSAHEMAQSTTTPAHNSLFQMPDLALLLLLFIVVLQTEPTSVTAHGCAPLHRCLQNGCVRNLRAGCPLSSPLRRSVRRGIAVPARIQRAN